MKKLQKFIINIFVAILVTFMISILARIIIKNIIVEKLNISNDFTVWALQGVSTTDAVDEVTGETFAQINWAELYPFQNQSNDAQIIETNKKEELLSKYKQKVKHVENVVNDYCTSYLVKRTYFVEKAYAYDSIIHWNLTSTSGSDGVITLQNGYLTQIRDKCDVTFLAENVKDLKDYTEAHDIDFLYVQAPSKMSYTDKMLPAGVNDYSNENADQLIQKIEMDHVDTLDLRPYIFDLAADYYGAFYRTDHHWKTTTAFYMAGILADYLNENYEYEFDSFYYDLNNYQVEHYSNYFLGSLGKKVTLSKANPEDYDLIVPAFDTDFAIQIPERYINLTGTFQEVLLDYRHLQSIDYYNENCYASFMNRNDAVATIHNNAPTCNKGKKILFIKDSYSTPLIPYIAEGIEDVETLYEIRFTGSIRTYIDQMKPDMVIVMYSADNIKGTGDGDAVPFNLQ